MPFIPAIGASVLSGLGVAGPVTAGAATAAGIGAIGAVAGAGYGLTQAAMAPGKAAAKSANNAANQAAQANAAAMQNLNDAKAAAATTAQGNLSKRVKSSSYQTIYTNPLGISGQATVARKTLLGQ